MCKPTKKPEYTYTANGTPVLTNMPPLRALLNRKDTMSDALAHYKNNAIVATPLDESQLKIIAIGSSHETETLLQEIFRLKLVIEILKSTPAPGLLEENNKLLKGLKEKIDDFWDHIIRLFP